VGQDGAGGAPRRGGALIRVLFWGTSDFALPTLRALEESPHSIVGVVTQPDRPAGRGRRLRPTPVGRAAEESGHPLLRPERPRGEEFLSELRELEPGISVVAAYGEILTGDVLRLPPRGSLNVHASLLPELRGAAPIHWAVIRGHERTGVTVMRMVRELDAGPILRTEAVAIGPETTAGELFGELSELGARLLVETLAALEEGEVEERPQDDGAATYAPKLSRDDVRLDWGRSREELDRWIRGCDPWPAAWSRFRPAGGGGDDGERGEGAREALDVQLFSPHLPEPGEDPAGEVPGRVIRADPREGIRVATGAGVLGIREVKPAGKRRMEAAAWVRGRGVSVGDRFV